MGFGSTAAGVKFPFFLTSALLAVTLVTPTEGASVTTAEFPIQWLFAPGTQDSYRVRIFSDSAGTVLVYNSGLVASAVMAHTVPAGSLENSTSHYLRVDITTTAPQSGQSDLIGFSISYAPSVDVADLTVVAVDSGLPHLKLDWSEVVPGGGESFKQYDVRRRKVGDTAWTRIAVITAIGTVQYLDYVPGAGVAYEYTVQWQALASGDTLISDRQDPEPAGTLTFNYAFLHEWTTVSRYAEIPAKQATVRPLQERDYRRARGRREPVVFIAEGRHRAIMLAGVPVAVTDVTLWDTIEELHDRQFTDGTTLVLRLGHRPGASYFVSMEDPQSRDAGAISDPSLRFREVFVDEAV